MKNSDDTIGNRTSDLPTCSAVPQPTALPRAPDELVYFLKKTSQIQKWAYLRKWIFFLVRQPLSGPWPPHSRGF